MIYNKYMQVECEFVEFTMYTFVQSSNKKYTVSLEFLYKFQKDKI